MPQKHMRNNNTINYTHETYNATRMNQTHKACSSGRGPAAGKPGGCGNMNNFVYFYSIPPSLFQHDASAVRPCLLLLWGDALHMHSCYIEVG